ncbi:MAG: hypothetical protein ABI645_04970 [Pseudomonadota bacterium]
MVLHEARGRIGVVFATVIAVVLLKAQLTRGRMIGIATIAVGAMVLVGWG